MFTLLGTEIDEDEILEAENVDNIYDMSALTFSLHGQSVYAVSMHPTKPDIVITGGGDDMGYIWKYSLKSRSIANLSESKELGGHTDTVTTAKFNFDGSYALTGPQNI